MTCAVCAPPAQSGKLHKRTGTPLYMAPELFMRYYGIESDQVLPCFCRIPPLFGFALLQEFMSCHAHDALGQAGLVEGKEAT